MHSVTPQQQRKNQCDALSMNSRVWLLKKPLNPSLHYSLLRPRVRIDAFHQTLHHKLQQPHFRRASTNVSKSISITHDLLYIIQLSFFLHFILAHVGTVTMTGGPSMLPTLTVEGDAVMISKYYRRGRGVKVGDVVSFSHPVDPEIGALKRLVALPGDFVMTGENNSRGEGLMIQVGSKWICHPAGEVE